MNAELSYREAAKLLGVSNRKLRSLRDDHQWETRRHPIDKRLRLLRRADVLTLLPKIVTESDSDEMESPTGLAKVGVLSIESVP